MPQAPKLGRAGFPARWASCYCHFLWAPADLKPWNQWTGTENRAAVTELFRPYIRKQEKYTPEQITARLFLPMVLEATRILEAKVVRDPRDVDLGLIFGVGFPPFKGGLL